MKIDEDGWRWAVLASASHYFPLQDAVEAKLAAKEAELQSTSEQIRVQQEALQMIRERGMCGTSYEAYEDLGSKVMQRRNL